MIICQPSMPTDVYHNSVWRYHGHLNCRPVSWISACSNAISRICSTLAKKDHNFFPWWYVTRFLTLLRKLVRAENRITNFKCTHVTLGRSRSVLVPPISFWQVDMLKPFKISLWRFPIAACAHKHLDAICESHVWEIFNVSWLSSGEEFHAQVWRVDGWHRTSFALSHRDGRSDDDCFRLGQHRSCDIVVDVYHQLLFDFFNDPVRSEKFCLSPMVFASAASRCRRFICR